MLQVILASLSILTTFQNTCWGLTINENLKDEKSISVSGRSTFYLNGRQHELPIIYVISKGKALFLGDGTYLKIPAFSNSTTNQEEAELFVINVTATYPFYVFYDRAKETMPSLRQKRYVSDVRNETSFVFQLSWWVFLPYLKSKNSSFEFRSNTSPFFGLSVEWFYDKNDDTVSLHNSPCIHSNHKDFFDQLRKGKDKASDCDAYLFRHNRNNANTGVTDRLYGCSFADGTKGDLFLGYLVINRVRMDRLGEAPENCIQACESNNKCQQTQLLTFRTRQWSAFGYCTNGIKEDNSSKLVYFSPIYVSLPHGPTPTTEIYYKLEDVRLDKMISMDPIEQYHPIGSTVTIRCHISETFAATPFRLALKYKRINDLEFLPVKDIAIFSLNLWSRSTSYNISLDRTDTERIFCFAPLLGSFGWVNASVPIQVTEPTLPSFLYDPKLSSEEIPKTRVSTFNVHKTFALGSRNETLTCYAIGDPSPKIFWTWNGVNIMESQGEHRPHEVSWSQLLFAQISKTTEGEYICTAINTQGVAHAKINVIVTDAPGSDTTSLALSIFLPILALALIAALTTALILFKRTKDSRKVITKQEYQDFLHGNVNADISNPHSDVFSKAFQPRFIIDQSCLEFDINSVLGSGHFGVVMKGWLINSDRSRMTVAVKTTKDDVDLKYAKALVSEVRIMEYIGDHGNIVKFLGVCINDFRKGKIYAGVEFCENGNLREWLQKQKALLIVFAESDKDPNTANNGSALGISDVPSSIKSNLEQWSHDIAKGMAFISSKKVIHGDLAARNVLLTKNNVAKISDFGLARVLLNDYSVYTKKTQEGLPWKWMALESLTSAQFSVQSDVWAFGVTLWEIFSLGDSLYPGARYNEQFIKNLSIGTRPLRPQLASDYICSIMERCWNTSPQMRPDMSQICDQLRQQLQNESTNTPEYLVL